ncbi:MAG TPA: NAD(P)-binding domain-containing protein [Candidatus Nanopelagicales bacterium]|nr:NAD(P)-binding domain-containing protein [Candidatus Nanopelagicales bacterium]
MRIAVLGTGTVGKALAGRLVQAGHEVRMGSRTPDNADGAAWAAQSGGGHGRFADVSAWGEVLVNATAGLVSLAALASVDPADIAGKVLLDVSNPLDFSGGFPPVLVQSGGYSVAEQIQQAYPSARVVKTLNTMNADLMVEPRSLGSPHTVFVAGDDAAAKALAGQLLAEFGWTADEVVDLGGIAAARGLEHYVRFWVDAMGALGTAAFNVRLVH